jgi:phenylacetate-CoA ligase
MLIIRGVNVFPTQIEEFVLRMPDLAPIYQILVSREGHLDTLDVNVELRPRVDPSKGPALGKQLQHDIKSYIGVSTTVHVLGPNSIERTAVGKAKRVIDNRPKG